MPPLDMIQTSRTRMVCRSSLRRREDRSSAEHEAGESVSENNSLAANQSSEQSVVTNNRNAQHQQQIIWTLGCGSFLFSFDNNQQEREEKQMQEQQSEEDDDDHLNVGQRRRRRAQRQRRRGRTRRKLRDSEVEADIDDESAAVAESSTDDSHSSRVSRENRNNQLGDNSNDDEQSVATDNNGDDEKNKFSSIGLTSNNGGKKCKTRLGTGTTRNHYYCCALNWANIIFALLFLLFTTYLLNETRLLLFNYNLFATESEAAPPLGWSVLGSPEMAATAQNKTATFKRSPNSIFDSFFSATTTTATTAASTNSQEAPHSSSSSSKSSSASQSNQNNNNNNAISNNVQQQQQQLPNSYNDVTHMSYRNGQTSDKVTLPGDILLGGLFPIHMKGTKVECGQINRDRGIQRLEAMLYALDRINEDSTLLPDIKLGAILLDSCSSSTYALNQSLEFIRASINTVESSAFECKDKSTPRPKYGSKMIAGVIGGSYSEVSLQVANLLRLFRIPQVSYASTGTALSDKTLYDLFARTVPSDMFQARAIADIVQKLNWSYVSLVSSEGLYGDSGSKEFVKQASNRRICIATHEKISPTIGENAYDQIVSNLEKRNATGVVLFTRAEDSRELLLAVKRAKLLHNFAWVAADGWGTHQKLVEGVEEVAWGAITVELQAKAIPGFDSYMKALTPWGNARNPWFSEYWQEWFDCQLQANLLQQQRLASGFTSRRRSTGGGGGDYATTASRRARSQQGAGGAKQRRSTVDEQAKPSGGRNCSSSPPPPKEEEEAAGGRRCVYPLAPLDSASPPQPAPTAPRRTRRSNSFVFNQDELELVKQFCSPNLRISESNGYRQEQKVQFVVDAVYAMAHALHKAWLHLCNGQPGVVCEALKELNGGEFYNKYLLNVSFKDMAGSEVKFDERGDGLGRYNIYNFRQVKSPNLLAAPNNKGLAVATSNSSDLSLPANDSGDSLVVVDSALELEGGGSSSQLPDAAQSSPIDKPIEGVPDGGGGGGGGGEGFGLFQSSSRIKSIASKDSIDQEQQATTPTGSSATASIDSTGNIYTSNVEFEYSTIGRWTEDEYEMKLEDVQFFQGESDVPESYCSRPCELGQAKILRAGDHCCWICKTCQPYEFLPDEFNCQDCGIGRWPVPNKTSCYDLPQKYLRWDSIFSLISLSIACLGIAFTIFVTVIFIKYLDTPVVKASGRELSFILLAGIACCHLSTFVLLAKPTSFICGTQRFLVNFGFALMYASLLVKTNRISRIFNCARKSAKRPSFISPKSQMLITGILVAIQIFLTIIWFVFEPPGIRADSPEGKRDEVILKCRAKGKSFIISLVYNMILITTCTIYAVKTRKIPENFNESKFIGFTMYTTIVIWLAFVTMFFGTNNSYEIQINTMCVCISLSAYVTLFCLFSPKISIILLHPDKNVRKLTMNSATYKRAFKPISSVASAEGRNNLASGYGGGGNGHSGGAGMGGLDGSGRMGATTGGQASVSGAQPDAASGGPMSTTSNVLNLADTSQNRFQESSIISNVVNSNSAGSHSSQKTPIDSSQQQLALIGVCVSCGAHQSASAMPVNSTSSSTSCKNNNEVANGILRTSATRFANGTGGALGANNSGATTNNVNHTIRSSSSMRQKFPPAQQCLITSSSSINNVVGCATTNSSIGRANNNSLNNNQSSKLSQQQQATTATTAKVLHNKLAGATPDGKQQHHGYHHHHQHGGGQVAPPEQIHLAHVQHHHSQQQPMTSSSSGKKKQIASMSRLNEMTSITSSAERNCIDDSISSLANDSFMNTSQENTPCNNNNGAGMVLHHNNNNGHTHRHQYNQSSADGLQQQQQQNNNRGRECRGSDSMLCNQSVQSMDYCSDCCPSLCHCSCPACSSNGGEDNGLAMLCAHTRSSIIGGGGDMDDEDDYDYDEHNSNTRGHGGETMCLMQLVHHQGECSMMSAKNSSRAQHTINNSSLDSINHRTAATASFRRRRSEEPSSGSAAVVGAKQTHSAGAKNEAEDLHWKSDSIMMVDNEQADGDASAAAAAAGSSSAKTRRSQTMEMQIIGATPTSRLESNEPSARAHHQRHQSQGKKRSSFSAKQQEQVAPTSMPIAYALQSAATSAFGAAATAAQIVPLSTSHFDDGDDGGDGDDDDGSPRISSNIQSQHSRRRAKRAQQQQQQSSSASHHHQKQHQQHDRNLQLTKSRESANSTATTKSKDHNRPVEQQQQQQAPSEGGTIQASLELVKKSEEARRKEQQQQQQLAAASSSAASRSRRKSSSCFNYHDDYEYSYGLVHSNSDSERDYYYDDYDSATEAQLAASASLSRKDPESSPGATRTGPADYDAAYEYYDDDDGGGDDNEDDGAVADGGGDLDDDDDFEHDGRVTLDREQQTRRRDGSSRGQHRQAKKDVQRGGSKPTTTSKRTKKATGEQSEELRINSVALITATLSTGGAIVESGSSSTPTTVNNQNVPKPAKAEAKQPNHETKTATTTQSGGGKISYLGTL